MEDSDPPERAHLTFRAELQAITGMNAALTEFACTAHLSEDLLFRLELTLEEMFSNTVKYGYAPDHSGSISLGLRADAEGVEVTMTDDANPFDPTGVRGPDLDGGVEDRPLGGLGLHLVRQMTDGLHYSLKDGRNLVRLRFERNRLARAPG